MATSHETQAPRAETPRRGTLRRWLRRVLFAILALVLIVGLAIAWVTQTGHGRKFLIAQVSSILSDSLFVGEIDARRVEGPIFGSLVLKDVTLTDDEGREAAYIEEASVRYTFTQLLRKRLVITRLNIEGVRVFGRIREDGSLNLANLFLPGNPDKVAPEQGFAVAIQRLQLHGEDLQIVDERVDELVVGFRDATLVGGFDMDGRGRIRVGVSELASQISFGLALGREFGARIDDLHVMMDPEEISFAAERLSIGETGLFGFDGAIERSDVIGRPFEYLEARMPQLVFSPEEVGALVPGLPLATTLTVDATLEGPPEDVALRAALSGDGQDATAEIKLDLSDEEDVGLRGVVLVEAFEPERWFAMPGLTGDLNAGIAFTAQGLTPQRLQAGLEMTIEPSTLLGYKLDSGVLRVGFAQEVVTLDEMRFEAGTATLSGEGRVALAGDTDLSIQLRAPDLSDLAESAPSAAKLRGSVEADLQVRGEVPFELLNAEAVGSVDGIIENVVRHLDVDASVVGRGVEVDGLRVGSVDARVTGRRGDALNVTVLGGARDIQSGDLSVPFVNLDARAQGDRLRLQADARALDTDLRVGLDGTWSARGVDVRMTELVLDRGGIQGALLHPARVVVGLDETGALTSVTLDDFDFEGVGAMLKVDGFRYSAGGRLRGQIDARIDALDELAPLIGQESLGLSGGLRVTGNIAGTVTRPRYEVELQARRVRAMDIGPVTGQLNATQLPTHLTMDGRLCLGAGNDNIPQTDCDGRQTLLYAQDLVLPILPGFTSIGPRFDDRGVLEGTVEIGPLDIALVADEVPAAAAYNPRGIVGVRMSLDGTFLEPKIAAIVSVEDVWVDLPLHENAPAIAFGPVSGVANVKMEDGGGGFSVVRWGLGGRGLEVDGQTWLRARGDVRAPVRGFLLAEVSPRELVQQTSGTLISLEVPERPLRDLPKGLLPEGLDPEGSLYLSADVTRTEGFSGAKLWFHGAEIIYDDIGPLEVFVSAVSAADTAAVVNVESADGAVRVNLDAVLEVSLLDLLMRGVEAEDRLSARLHVPQMTLSSIPVAGVRAQVSSLLGVDEQMRSPQIGGYLDVYNTLDELRVLGRFHAQDIQTATGGMTEAGLEIAFAPANLLGFYGDPSPRLQLMLSVCGLDDECAMEFYASAVPGVRSGTFLFGDEDARAEAVDRLLRSPYAAVLRADRAPLAALAPAFLIREYATSLDGELSADLRVDGTLDALPEVRGTLELEAVRGEILPLARSIERLDLQLEAGPQGIRMERLFVDDGVGTIDGVGELRLVDGRAHSAVLDFELTRFLLADASGLGVFLSAGVPINIDISDTRIDVDLRIDRGDIYVPDSATSGSGGGLSSLPETIIFLEEGQSLSEYVDEEEMRVREAQVEGAMRSFGVPVHVHAYSREDVRVRQRFADLTLDVDMTLRLDGGDIATSGGVTVTEGHAQAFGKRFDVTLGRVLFDGGGAGPFDPRLRVTAVHRLPRNAASLLPAPSGPYASVSVLMDTYVSKLDINLRSDPPMSESDILNVLLTGKPIESDGEARPEALTTAGTLLAGFLTDQLGTNPVIDSLSVELNDSDGTLDSRFEGGRYFGKDNRIFASVAYIAGADAGENSVEVAWQFILAQMRRSSLRLELSWGNRRTGAVEFLYDLRLERGMKFVR